MATDSCKSVHNEIPTSVSVVLGYYSGHRPINSQEPLAKIHFHYYIWYFFFTFGLLKAGNLHLYSASPFCLVGHWY